MTVLLDTSVLVALEADRLAPTALPERAVLSVITLEELHLGLLRAAPDVVGHRRRTYERALAAFDVVPVDLDIAESCAEIRAEGRTRGVRYTPFDSLIGATARVHALPLYTQDAGMLGMAGVDVRVV